MHDGYFELFAFLAHLERIPGEIAIQRVYEWCPQRIEGLAGSDPER
jgi:hypothetical protein